MKILVIVLLIVLLSIISINDVFAWEINGNTVSGVFKSSLLTVSVQDENYQPYSSVSIQNVPIDTPFSFELPAMESGTYRVIIKQGNIGAESEISEFFNYIAPTNEEQEIDEIEKINPENEYLTKEREWLTSGPFQIDRSKYAIGEKIFLVVDGLGENEKGQVAFMRPLNATHYSVYVTIPFDGSTKSSFNYYVEPQLSKIKELCSVEDLIGKWTVVFRGTTYSNLDFEITQDVIPGTNVESVCPNTIKELKPTTKVPDWVKNNAKWWGEDQINDYTFVSGIQFLIQEKVVDIPNLPEQTSNQTNEKPIAPFVDVSKDPQHYVDRYNNEPSYKKWFDENYPDYTIEEAVRAPAPIPGWIKNTASWWADGMISEDEFIKGIEYLIEKRILKVESTKSTAETETKPIVETKPPVETKPKETPKLFTSSGTIPRQVDVDSLYVDAELHSLSSIGYDYSRKRDQDTHDGFVNWFELNKDSIRKQLDGFSSSDTEKIIESIELISLARITNGDATDVEDAKTFVDDYLKKNILPQVDLSHLEQLLPVRDDIPSAYMIQDSVDYAQGENYRIPLTESTHKISGFNNVLSQVYKKGDWRDHIFVNIFEFDSISSANSFYDDFTTAIKNNQGIDVKKSSEYTSNCFVTGEGTSMGGMASVYCQYSNIYFEVLSSSVWSGGIEVAETNLDFKIAKGIMNRLE